MQTRNRGMNIPKDMLPVYVEAVKHFNREFIRIERYPSMSLVGAILEDREPSPEELEDAKMDSAFSATLCRNYAKFLFRSINMHAVNQPMDSMLFPMVSWTVVIAYDNALVNNQLYKASVLRISPDVWLRNTELALYLVLRALADCGLLYFADKNLASVREDFHPEWILANLDDYEFIEPNRTSLD